VVCDHVTAKLQKTRQGAVYRPECQNLEEFDSGLRWRIG